MRVFTVFCVLVVGLLFGSGLSAHQQQEAYTTLTFNPRSGNIEIVHRFYLHDAEHAIKRIFAGQADLLSAPETREKFSRYVASRFALKDQQGAGVKVRTLGEEVEGKFLWTYQEVENTTLDQLEWIDIQFLYEVWPRHRNIVNIAYPEKVKSLRFEKSNDWKRLPRP